MVFRKRAIRRRPIRKGKKVIRRKTKSGVSGAIVSQMKNLNTTKQKLMSFEKTSRSVINGTTFITGTNNQDTYLGGALPSSMPDWGSITQLFNRYRLDAITYTFTLTNEYETPVDMFSTRMPKMYIRYNYDSNLTSGNVGDKLQELPNVKLFSFTPTKTQFSYTYYPRCIEPVYLSSIATGYRLAPKRFIDVAYGDIPHYGLMWNIDFLADGLQIQYDITWRQTFKYEA